MQFGLHAALQVGNVILEWNDSSLVIPHFCSPEEQVLEVDVQGESKWAEFTSEQYQNVRKVVTTSNYQKQIELIYHVIAEKHHQIQALIAVIIKYNTTYYYNSLEPGLPMFFNVSRENWEGLVDFADVMDVV